ncbi:MAG: methyltransferase domain-containing protein, partial [Moorea sp. SIOASIH]|uniref:class I SAM-dependent methyltransferase n=1 Tax=Moorena sp. SIOASIH TaxID=2607817 RepID=UPI0013BDEA4E
MQKVPRTPKVYVLMPFSEEFRDVYELGIKPAAERAGAQAERVDEQHFTGNIVAKILSEIERADLIVADMTNRNPNVFYEVGYAHAAGKRVIHITQSADDIPFDLKQFPHVIYSRSTISKLRDDLGEKLRALLPSSNVHDIHGWLLEIGRHGNHVQKNKSIDENDAFAATVFEVARGFAYRLRDLEKYESVFRVSADRYPHVLLALQSEQHQAVVDAIALVNRQEYFWSQSLGDKILDTTQPGSRRIFVLKDESEVPSFYETLCRHHSRSSYEVYVLLAETLHQRFAAYNKDFSVIKLPGGEVLAQYDKSYYADTRFERQIEFDATPQHVASHASKFEEILNASVRFDSGATAEELARSLSVAPSGFSQGTQEMSLYISIDDYDKYEEKHVHYVEMREKIREVCDNEWNGPGKRVLEFGAGTGLFTMSMVDHNAIDEFVAVELDVVCFDKLRAKLNTVKDKTTRALLKDSRTYDPGGKFDCIFSVFADHHIKPQDKRDYFA